MTHPTRWPRRCVAAAGRRRDRDGAADDRLRAGRGRAGRRAKASAASAIPSRRGLPGPGRGARRPSARSAWRRTACGRCRGRGWRRSRATPRASGMVVHIHANEQRRELEECLAEHGMRPGRAAGRRRPAGPRTTLIHATHVSDPELDLVAAGGVDRLRLPDHRGQSGRRLPAGRCAVRAGRFRSASAPTRTPSSIRCSSCARWRRSPAAAASAGTSWCRPGTTGRPATCWTPAAAAALAALGITKPLPEVEIVRDHPVLRDVAERDLAGGADLRRRLFRPPSDRLRSALWTSPSAPN